MLVLMWVATACSIGLVGGGVFCALKRRWPVFSVLAVLALATGTIAVYLWIRYLGAMAGWGEIGGALD